MFAIVVRSWVALGCADLELAVLVLVTGIGNGDRRAVVLHVEIVGAAADLVEHCAAADGHVELAVDDFDLDLLVGLRSRDDVALQDEVHVAGGCHREVGRRRGVVANLGAHFRTGRDRGDRGTGVVVLDDVGVVPALLGVAQRAVLAQADAVTEPAAVDWERRRRGGGLGGGYDDTGDARDERGRGEQGFQDSGHESIFTRRMGELMPRRRWTRFGPNSG